MLLMRGPQPEEQVVEVKEEERSGPLRILALPPTPDENSPADGNEIVLQWVARRYFEVHILEVLPYGLIIL